MKKLYLLLLITITTIISAKAQNIYVSGKIVNQQGMPLYGADVVLLNSYDSTFIKGAVADTKGAFIIKDISSGKYIIKISYLGYDNLFINKIISLQPFLIGTIVLNSKSSYLKGVSIVDTLPPAEQKGDTTQYNAGAFKTNPDATAEDLVTKMPGITSQNNKVQAQNEDVKQVLVNGKPFFGDDPNAVLKNIPADVIDKIQVYDEKSDQAQFTGFDDGNTSKTINIITKTKFKNGTFGKIYGGYGYDDKWKGGFNLNFFKDNRRITILAQSNNINDQNFSSEDLLGVVASSGGNRGSRGSFGGHGGYSGNNSQYMPENNSNNFLVNQQNGIATTNSFGINYVDKWKNVDFTGSYFLNYTDNNDVSNLFRQYITQKDSGLTYSEKNSANSKNINHRANIKLDWKIDSLNSILFRPKISIQQNTSSSTLTGENQQAENILSNTANDYSSNLTGININAPILYRHSFHKKKRTLSLSISPGYNQNKGYSHLNTYTNYFSDTLSSDTLNQLANLNKQGEVLNSNVTYTEPINDKTQMLFTYGTNYNKSPSDKETYNFSVNNNTYDIFDTVLSNKFTSKYFSQSFGTSCRYQRTKWSMNAGLTYQQAQLDNKQIFPTEFILDKTFKSLLPGAMFQYKFSQKKNLRIFYRSYNTAPTITQLQSVIDNSNPLQLTSGNPDLKQNWQNSVIMRYSEVNTEKSTSFFALFNGTFIHNYIANSAIIAPYDTMLTQGIILASGSQYLRPVNLNGYYNLSSFVNYSFTIPKIKSNMNINVGGTYSCTPGLINYYLNDAYNYSAGLGLVLSSNVSEKVDFMVSSNTTYNNIVSSLQQNLNSTYYNQSSKFKIQLMPWKGLVLETDLNHQYYYGLSQNKNQNYLLWNAAIGYKFLKNKAADIRLSVYDILKQNTSITRNTTDTYYEDVQTIVLQRYIMLTFTYNLKKYNNTDQSGDHQYQDYKGHDH